MKIRKARKVSILLSFLALFAMLVFENGLVALLLSAVCVLGAVGMIYPNLAELTDLSDDNPKVRTLKFMTVFDTAVFVCCVAAAALIGTGTVEMTERGERAFAAAVTVAILLVSGNIAPKLPRSSHTGLRLPWTVADEDTWIVAHRLLGYISIPLALVYVACIPVVSNFGLLSMVVLILWVCIPGGLSYVFYLKKIKGSL